MPMRREDCLDVSAVEPRPVNSGYTPGAVARNLSTESKTGGEHLVMELPAGWSLPRGRNEADIDLYVLEGSLDIGGETWMQGCYGYFPAGMAWGPVSTSGGCRLLLFTSRPLSFEEAGGSLADAHIDRHIGRTNTWHMPWVDPMADIVKRSTWKDPNTGQEARPPGVRHGPVCSISGAFWLIYLADYYTGIFGKVEDWEQRVNNYFASASFR